jgi:PAS domain S-box-containing protein
MMPAKHLILEKDPKFRLLFEEHPQPMWVIDPVERRILEANAAAEALYGHTREQFRGMSLDVLMVDEETVQPSGTRRHRTSTGRVIDVEMGQHQIDFDGYPAASIAEDGVGGHAGGRRGARFQ